MENTTIPENFELIVHIGTGKTGSTSIQHSLLENEDWLHENNTAYFGLMLENTPQQYFAWQQQCDLHGLNDQEEPERKQAQTELQYVLIEAIKSVSTLGVTRAIWSNESIFDTSSLVIPVLTHLIEFGIRINIIVYIRRHDAWLRSAYLQWGVKHKKNTGSLKPFSEWSKEYLPNFSAKLEPWLQQEKWAKIAVRNFDTCGNVVNDFFEYCSLYHPDIKIVRSNDTPSDACLAVWAMYNAQFDEAVLPDDIEILLDSAGLLNKKLQECDVNNLLPVPEDIEEIKLAASEDRNAINQIFSRFSQPDMKTTPLKITQETVTQNNINTMLLLLLKKQFDETRRLEQCLRDSQDSLKNQFDKIYRIEQSLPNMQNMLKEQADKTYRLEQLLPDMQADNNKLHSELSHVKNQIDLLNSKRLISRFRKLLGIIANNRR